MRPSSKNVFFARINSSSDPDIFTNANFADMLNILTRTVACAAVVKVMLQLTASVAIDTVTAALHTNPLSAMAYTSIGPAILFAIVAIIRIMVKLAPNLKAEPSANGESILI